MRIAPPLLTLIALLASLLISAAPARADVIHLTSGGKIRGKIVKETRRKVTIKTRGSTTVITRDRIDRIERKATTEDAYKEKLAKINKKDPEARYALGLWLKKEGERRLARDEFKAVIDLEPDHRFARDQLGYVKQDGEWVKRDAVDSGSQREGSSKSKASKPARPFDKPASLGLLQALENIRSRKASAAERTAGYETLADKAAEVTRIQALLKGEGHGKLRAAVIKHSPAAVSASDLSPFVEPYVTAVLWPALETSLGAYARSLGRTHKRSVRKGLGAFKEYRPGEKLGEKRTKALSKWVETRDAALKVIFDKSIYPDENHGKVGQPTVDEHVEKVRASYPALERLLTKDVAKLLDWSEDDAKKVLARMEEDYQRWAEAVKRVRARGIEAPDAERGPVGLLCLLLHRAGLFSDAYELEGQLNDWEKLMLRRLADERVLAYNARKRSKKRPKVGAVPTGEEVEQVAITNEYRMLMGRPALEIDPRLVLSARGHSADMSARGFFDHTSPVQGKRTPSQRMGKAGYHGGGGENISLGSSSPRATHIAWYNSSGHHRNILHRTWRVMGSGKDGKHWTQNFGSSSTLPR